MLQKITVSSIANGGYGIGRIDGKTIFIDFAVPGDFLLVEICREKKNFAFARIREIIKPSPVREIPLCRNFSTCGGCSYQNVSYETEISFKHKILTELLVRITGLDPDVIPVIDIISDGRYKYRSHASIKSDNKIKGFYQKESDQLIELPPEGCLLLHDRLNEGIDSLDPALLGKDTKVAVDPDMNIVTDNGVAGIFVLENELGFKFRHDVTGFFQANMLLRSRMIERVVEYAEPSLQDSFMDICCGCGFFSIPLATRCLRGYCFDNDRRSIMNAEYNSRINNLSNLSFEIMPESDIHPFRYKPDFIVIDPPRAGISKKGRKTINTIKPEKFIYVSCDPSTFARDASDFIKNDFVLDRLTLIDMFPCTKHIELISRFSRV